MSLTLQILFWLLVACILYAYAAYPLLVLALGRLFGSPIRRSGRVPHSVSIVIAAYNEEKNIARRVRELAGHIANAKLDGEIIVVSDGSTDGTVKAAQEALALCGAGALTGTPAPIASPGQGEDRADEGVGTTIALPANRGKAVALNAGCAAARNEIILFADARQSWAPDAIPRLLQNFSDPAVGAATGDLVLEAEPGVMAGVGLYWRYEKWLRRQESRLHCTVGVTGAIAAVRRELYRPLPPGTILDDVCWPLNVAMRGYRVVHEENAKAFDRLPSHARDEFRRKVRTLSANFQLLARLPQALLPWRNPIALQFISHKLLRLLAPWCMLGALLISAVLPQPVYRIAFVAQLALVLLGLLGLYAPVIKSRLASAAASFLVLNSAAWLAFWVWLFGRTGRSWKKVAYKGGDA